MRNGGGALAVSLITLIAWTPGIGQALDPPAIGVRARSLQPGELMVVSISLPPGSRDVRVTGLNQSVAAYAVGAAKWQALLGIDLDTPPGDQRISAAATADDRPLIVETTIAVAPKAFPTRRLAVAPEFVNPPAAARARIAREAQLIADILAASVAERLWRPPFVRPVPDSANSRFGSRSVFNGEPRNPHGGADFMSPAGRPVRAPAAGRVVLAQDLYYSGKSVILDHGLGVFSQLLHLSRIDVAVGQTIESGTVIGLVGATGRVTGPHLHWGLRVGGARVDPLAALALLDEP
jgi:murein DD-endopeptidase MepM/ murein hydrolase activator NlpD